MVDIMQILTWAIPSGGIGAAIAWIANYRVKKTLQAKQIHDTFKEMYGDVSKELLAKQKELNDAARENAEAIERLNKENALTRYALNRLSRAIEAIPLCPHHATCPVTSELQNSEESPEPEPRAKRRQQHKPKQPEGGDGTDHEKGDVDRAHPGGHGDAEHRPRKSGKPADGSAV